MPPNSIPEMNKLEIFVLGKFKNKYIYKKLIIYSSSSVSFGEKQNV